MSQVLSAVSLDSVASMKQFLIAQRVGFADCVEKSDLLRRVQETQQRLAGQKQQVNKCDCMQGTAHSHDGEAAAAAAAAEKPAAKAGGGECCTARRRRNIVNEHQTDFAIFLFCWCSVQPSCFTSLLVLFPATAPSSQIR
jgi:hypothetical protein